MMVSIAALVICTPLFFFFTYKLSRSKNLMAAVWLLGALLALLVSWASIVRLVLPDFFTPIGS